MERRHLLRTYGAEPVLTPAEQGNVGRRRARRADRAADAGGVHAVAIRQPRQPADARDHDGPEILDGVGADLTAFVAGVGTGGTITGVGRVLKREKPGVVVVGVEPAASAVLSGKPAAMHGIQGIGAGFVPDILDRSVIDRVMTVSDVAADKMTQRLAREEGLLVGPSSGANVHAAIEVAKGLPGGVVVTILCDTGERYLF